MLQDTEDKRKEKRKQKVQNNLPCSMFLNSILLKSLKAQAATLSLCSIAHIPVYSLYSLGAEALCGRNAAEGSEEGPEGAEPSARVEHDGSG